MNEKKFLKNESKFLMTETLIVQKLAYIFVLLGEGEWFSYLFSVLRKISYKLGKKIGKFQTFSSSLFSPKKTRTKKVRRHVGLNVANRALVEITKPWTPYLFPVQRYRGSKMKNTQKLRFFKSCKTP